VPAAVLFDLWLEDAPLRPDAAAGYAACVAARREPAAQGSVGAGAGATVGKLFGIERAMKGGIGSASVTVGAVTVAALVAVNATGDVIDPATGGVIAGTRGSDGQPRSAVLAMLAGELPQRAIAGMATTIGVIATDAVLTKSQANKLATMAHDGLARTIHPVHTMADGDTLFPLATGASGRPGEMTVLGVMAAEVTAQAVLNAVRHASGLRSPDLPSASDLGRA
jgi:L-aminopeptidase/D-esterase-like protein